MYEIILYALVFLATPLALFAIFSWAILYHILKYGYKMSTNKKIAFVFSIVMLAIALNVTQKFFAVDWNSISVTDFLEKSNLNIFINMYGR